MMPPLTKSVPFKSDDLYSGFAEMSGMLHVERTHLELEFEVRDSIMGVLKSGAKELKLSYHDLDRAVYKKTWFTSRFQIFVKRMKTVSDFPGAKDGCIELKIKRKHKDALDEMETYVNLRIAEMGLERLEDQTT